MAELIESLTEARAAGNLSCRLRVLTHPALLVVDEIGYLPVNQDGAVLFFQLINARHERASTVLGTTKIRGVRIDVLVKNTGVSGHGVCGSRSGSATAAA